MQKDKALSIYLKRLRLDNHDERLIDMANKLNISQSFLSAIESGTRNLSNKLVRKIVEIYKLDEKNEKELIYLRDLASHKINITLENLEEEQKEAVVQFLSNVKDLDEKSLEKIKLIIREHKINYKK